MFRFGLLVALLVVELFFVLKDISDAAMKGKSKKFMFGVLRVIILFVIFQYI